MIPNFLGRPRRRGGAPAADPAAPAVPMTEAQRRSLLMAVALLIDYPEEERITGLLDAVAESAGELPEPAAAPLRHFLTAARELGPRGLAVHYVDTFDRRRRCTPYLSYYATGDTRARGAALLSFRELLAAVGLEPDPAREELPDHLAVVCEAAAREPGTVAGGDAIAAAALAAHRDGIEVLRHALADRGSPYAHLIEALVTALPALDEDTRRRYLDLVTAGPPAELVGTADLPFPMIRQENHA